MIITRRRFSAENKYECGEGRLGGVELELPSKRQVSTERTGSPPPSCLLQVSPNSNNNSYLRAVAGRLGQCTGAG
eukprot:scaffold127140_cov72-Phaeocystis_antarctica.AAC.3